MKPIFNIPFQVLL